MINACSSVFRQFYWLPKSDQSLKALQYRFSNKRATVCSGKNLIVREQQSALTGGAYRGTKMRRLETAVASCGFPRQPGFVNLTKQP
jgi:hypothetical protein